MLRNESSPYLIRPLEISWQDVKTSILAQNLNHRQPLEHIKKIRFAYLRTSANMTSASHTTLSFTRATQRTLPISPRVFSRTVSLVKTSPGTTGCRNRHFSTDAR